MNYEHIIMSYNVNGGGQKSFKVVQAITAVAKEHGKKPTAIFLQELRRPLFQSHIEDY